MNREKQVKYGVAKMVKGRKDLSPYLIHLTRDSSKIGEDGKLAYDNLLSILQTSTIHARNIDCYRQNLIPNHLRETFKVMSLTETPLTEIDKLADRKFSPYGVAFSRDYVIEQNGVPVTYIYKGQRIYFDKLIDECASKWNKDRDDSLFLKHIDILPYLKITDSKEIDFHWEREWKVKGDFVFDSIYAYAGEMTRYTMLIIVPTLEDAKRLYDEIYKPLQKEADFYVLEESNRYKFFRYQIIPVDTNKEEEVYIIYEDNGEEFLDIVDLIYVRDYDPVNYL